MNIINRMSKFQLGGEFRSSSWTLGCHRLGSRRKESDRRPWASLGLLGLQHWKRWPTVSWRGVNNDYKYGIHELLKQDMRTVMGAANVVHKMTLLCCCRRRRLGVPPPCLHIYQGDNNEVQHGLQRIVQLEYWFLSPDKSPLMHFSHDRWIVRAIFVGQLVRHSIRYLFDDFSEINNSPLYCYHSSNASSMSFRWDL